MNYKTLTLTLLLGLGACTNIQAEEMMNHEGHDMAQMEGMNHEGHDMAQMEGMNHEGHDMAQMEGMNHEGHDMAAIQTEQALIKGTISRIDEANGKVGLKHEAITNLKMPPMTMTFLVADPALLKGLKVGDAVLFHAEQPAGKLTVTKLQKQ